MNLRNHVRALAMGSMLALAIVSVPAVHVHAEDKNNGIVMDCLNKSTGEWTLSGQVEYVKTSDGKTHVVGCDDGHWVDLGVVGGRLSTESPVRPVAPLPIGVAIGSQP